MWRNYGENVGYWCWVFSIKAFWQMVKGYYLCYNTLVALYKIHTEKGILNLSNVPWHHFIGQARLCGRIKRYSWFSTNWCLAWKWKESWMVVYHLFLFYVCWNLLRQICNETGKKKIKSFSLALLLKFYQLPAL